MAARPIDALEPGSTSSRPSAGLLPPPALASHGGSVSGAAPTTCARSSAGRHSHACTAALLPPLVPRARASLRASPPRVAAATTRSAGCSPWLHGVARSKARSTNSSASVGVGRPLSSRRGGSGSCATSDAAERHTRQWWRRMGEEARKARGACISGQVGVRTSNGRPGVQNCGALSTRQCVTLSTQYAGSSIPTLVPGEKNHASGPPRCRACPPCAHPPRSCAVGPSANASHCAPIWCTRPPSSCASSDSPPAAPSPSALPCPTSRASAALRPAAAPPHSALVAAAHDDGSTAHEALSAHMCIGRWRTDTDGEAHPCAAGWMEGGAVGWGLRSTHAQREH
eukprot:351323-Chlamydomonas_euryale.AAC.1